jgi:autotransporter-like protein
MVIINKKLWRWIYTVLTLSLLGLSQNVAATLDGTFNGSSSVTLQCFGPPAGPVTIAGSASLVATGTTATLTIQDSAGDYSYSGTGSINQTGTNSFDFSFSGPATINTGNSILDGAYTSFVNLSTNLSGSTLTVTSGVNAESFVASPPTNCTGTINIDTTISSLSQGGTVITPAITPSSTVTEAVLFNTQVQGMISDVSSHISGALSGIGFFGGPRFTDNQIKVGGATGLNAGDGSSLPYGVWGSYSYTDYENELSSIAFDGTSHSFLGGIDFGFWDTTILGVAFGYDTGNIDTTFNAGNQETDTYTIAPYFGALLTDSLSVDFTLGYSKVEYDQFRTLPGTTTRVNSAPNADRVFGALNLNAITFYENWILGGRVGAQYASSTLDSYTESNGAVVADIRTRLGSVSIAGDVAYSYQEYEPFINLAYYNDFQLKEISVTSGPQPSNDSDDILMTAGVRYYNKNGVTGNFEYSKRFLREDFDEDRISMTIRADF